MATAKYLRSHHLHQGVGNVPIRERPATEGWLNLKSNELLHHDALVWTKEFLQEMSGDLVVRYPTHASAIDAVASFHGVDPSEVLLSAGSDTAIGLVVAALATRTRRLITFNSEYYAWREYADVFGVSAIEVPIDPFDTEDLIRDRLVEVMVSHPPSVVAISTPHGNSGLELTPPTLAALASASDAHGHVLVVDACYEAFGKRAVSSSLSPRDNVVRLHSYSKSMGLAGARIAAIIASEYLVSYLKHWRVDAPVSSLSTALLTDRLSDCIRISRIWNDVVRWRSEFRDRAQERLRQWSCLPSNGNFIGIATGSHALAQAAENACAASRIRIARPTGPERWARMVRITVPPPELQDKVLDVLYAAHRQRA